MLVSWHVESGAWVEAEQPLATLETTKTTYVIDAPVAGYAFFDHPANTLVPVGAAIVWISERNEKPLMQAGAPPAPSGEAAGGPLRFSRKAVRLMKQHGLTESDFPSSGRIGTADVERRANELAVG